jgi:Tol biopolymer transport system component
VIFLSDRGGGFDLWTKRIDGVGEADLLLDREKAIQEAFWTPDGEWIVFREGGVLASFSGVRDILRFRPEVDSVPEPLATTEADETGPALSPNGRWLAYVSTETGRREVFLTPFSSTERWKVQVSVDGARGPVWGPSGEELFFVSLGGVLASRDLWVARIDPGPRPTVIERELLFSLPEGFYFANNTTTYSFPNNGKGFLMARAPDTPGDELVLVRNWIELVKDRVGR